MYRNKIFIFLVIISLFASVIPFHSFNNGLNKDEGENKKPLHAQLCCCGTNASTCQDCGCSVDFGEDDGGQEDGIPQQYDGNGKRIAIITSCGGNSDYISSSTELTYFTSKSTFSYYSPFSSLLEAVTLRLNGPLLTPPYKPPKA